MELLEISFLQVVFAGLGGERARNDERIMHTMVVDQKWTQVSAEDSKSVDWALEYVNAIKNKRPDSLQLKRKDHKEG